jgi:hypothetical protein
VSARRLIGAWALAATVALAPAASRAQSDADRATAHQLTFEAEQKLAAHDYEAAYALLAKAHVLVPSPMIKVGMGRAKAAMGQLIEAQQHFVEASKSSRRPNEPASWAAARDLARREAEAVTPRLASLEFAVEGPPGPGAVRVVIDRRDEVPRAALEGAIPRAVNPGSHEVRAEAEGFKPFEAHVGIAEGEKKKVSVRLVASTSAEPAAASSPAEAAAGSAEGPDAAAKPGGSRWNALTLGGVAAAGVFGAVGVVTGVMSWSRVSDVKSRCEGDRCLESDRDEIDSARGLGTVSTVAFVGAAAGGAVALIGFLSAKPSAQADAKAQGRVSVTVGPGSIGVSGRF